MPFAFCNLHPIGNLLDAPATTMAKRRHSDRKSVDDEFGLEFVLEELRGSEAPRNKEVLLHFFFFLRRDGRGQNSTWDAFYDVVKSIKAQWLGSGVEMATDPTLKKKLYFTYCKICRNVFISMQA